ncbi:transcriptional regulator [Bacillus sp. FJAT-18017]|uniref:sigma-54-dependent Fis family transcriptional regulator n=1 Tax=Bacillus sp. FJAT-18017 TaxID=1705566 RepID=UPI0006AF2326|nr:sigma-54-dependent Fis family transcriptional regulator [Bacillus sp. FJAT-18017]ALC88571.1 transcriptional regulator [Bacillus sp. FJAT-18017]
MRSNKTILIVDDEASVRTVLKALLKREGYEVDTASDGEEAIAKAKALHPALVIMDIRMPNKDGMEAFREIREFDKDINVIMMTAFAAVETAVEAMRNGAYDYIIKPFNNDEVKILVKRALQVQNLKEEVQVLHRELSNNYRLDKLLTNSPKMMQLYKVIGKVAQTNASVLITGESGTGKELAANTIHYNSQRMKGPFIKINCGALPEGLLESELFGHEKGAFTGAVQRKPGRFELAEGGTIFLDEIGEVSQALQVKLLRVLQEHEFERVGGTQTIKADFRVIAATNRNLLSMIENGEFREDLYYRLNVVPLEIPPLRERKEDIKLLANFFLQKFSQENNKEIVTFDEDALKLLEEYTWPGNVRELSNIVERAVIMSTGSIIFPEDIFINQEVFHQKRKTTETNHVTGKEVETLPLRLADGQSLKDLIKQVENVIIQNKLTENHGNKMQTAKDLGISRRALLYKIQEYEIE